MKINLDLLNQKRKTIYNFYNLKFSENGKPMKEINNKLVFHPILVPYLINDFLDVYEKNAIKEALIIAIHIAELSLTEAKEYQNSLVFWYDPKDGLSSMPNKFFSGLTQSWYVKSFARLSKIEVKYKAITQKFFNSLMIPIEENGVLLKKEFGWIVEEYPFDPPLYTLNGWLTVLRWLVESEDLLSDIKNYYSFIENNLKAVKHLLPLYDAKFCFNSRYQLTGFTRFKIIFPSGVEYKINNFKITIPNNGEYEGKLKKTLTKRWDNYIEREEKRLVQFNIVKSLVSYPEVNKFNAEIYVDKECEIKCYLADGDYLPNSTGMPTKRWREIELVRLKKGFNEISINLKWDNDNMFAYPTNFKKDIYKGKGKKYNAYHFVHIADLASLYAFSKNIFFYDYCIKWIGYMDHWDKLEYIDQNKYSLEHYLGDKFMNNVYKTLKKGQLNESK